MAWTTLLFCLPLLVSASNQFGEDFLRENKHKDGVITLASGLQYRVLRAGTGKSHPTVDSPCKCHYLGRTAENHPSGPKFDSSYSRGEPTTFAPNQVISGWTEAMQLMVEGDQWEMYIPSQLAYGEGGSPPAIPGGSVLVFTMELLKVMGGKTPALKQSAPASAAGGAAPLFVKCEVAKLVGQPAEASFTLQVHPEWAPLGAKRLQELVEARFLDGVRFFRVIDGFMGQFGIHGDPAVQREWGSKNIKDDPGRAGVSNSRGRLTFAMAGKNTRSTQFFINFKDNSFLDKMGFTPIAEVVEGMDVVDRIFKVGEGAPSGPGPSQGLIQQQGNGYLESHFPTLSFVKSCRGVEAPAGERAALEQAPASDPVVDLGSGLKLKVTQPGDGVTFPRSGDFLLMHYVLTLAGDASGKVIDSSRARNDPFGFTIGRGEVIRGWDIGIIKMSLGQRGVLTVPAALAYGARGAGEIPGGAGLSFEIEVLGINEHHSAAAAGLDIAYDPLGVGTIIVVLAVSLGVLFLVACRGVGKKPGGPETKDVASRSSAPRVAQTTTYTTIGAACIDQPVSPAPSSSDWV